MTRLTIATLTKNCLQYTKVLIDSLNKWADIPYLLIVVDNNSTDGTRECLKGMKNTHLVLNKINRGFGPANNQAFKLANTEYFLGLNNDTVIFPNFLSKLLKFADEHEEYAEFGVASNCIGAKNPRTDRLINDEIKESELDTKSPENIISDYFPDPKNFIGMFGEKNPGYELLKVPPHFTGGWGLLARTEAVKRSGGLFDPQFATGFWEDVDLSWRLHETGYEICHINSLYLHHFTHVSFKANKLRYTDHAFSQKNAIRFARKWSEVIRKYLNGEIISGKTLKQICTEIHIFGAFFGRKREDWNKMEIQLKDKFINGKMNFADFLLMQPEEK